ncbi:MAG: hypothetical protein KIT43_12335 [Bauldia sp.]|nr:hypothetical protein [Bauldia sp.]
MPTARTTAIWVVLVLLITGLLAVSPLAQWRAISGGVGHETEGDCPATSGSVVADLCAQLRMADAAERVVDLGWWQFALGILTLAGLGLTVHFARIAANAGIDSSKAATLSTVFAESQNKLSELSLIAGQRAYVHYNSIGYVSHRTDNEQRLFWRLHPNWVNVGNTPAKNCRFEVKSKLIDVSDDEYFDLSLNALMLSSPIDLHQGATIRSGQLSVWGDELAEVKHGKKRLFVWGAIQYVDVFPNTPTHMTRFMVEAKNITGDPTNNFHADTNIVAIDWVNIGRHTCTDEGCAATVKRR